MATKESSDELNPTTTAAASIPKTSRSPKDFIALALSTCGVGYMPLAPGTWGSLLAVGFYLVLRFGLLHSPLFVPTQLVIILAVTIVGVWAATHTEHVLQIKDPGKVVIDEVAGQLIALLPVAFGKNPIVWIVTAFLLFRFFDIVKPYPARKLESLRGGLGIMADDLVAGVYAAIVVAVLMVI